MKSSFFSIALTVVFVGVSIQFPINSGRYNDYKNHTCLRDCSDRRSPMICEYDFVLETYVTMSKACYGCPVNGTDCSREHCLTADGFKKAIQVVNRLLPGPSIQVCKGDTIVVNVENRLESDEGTSIHWHGLRMRNKNYMDGSPMITQCPIMRNNKMKYEFVAEDAGTHWWHSQSALQYADGLFGSLIVRQNRAYEMNANLYDYDLADHVIMINDWSHQPSIAWNALYLHADGWSLDRSILINGKGFMNNPMFVYPDDTKDKSLIQTPLAKFLVKPNKRYRFRLIDSGSYFCPKRFSMDGHNLTLISIDGNPIEPVEVESIVTQQGERYDFVISTKADPKNYFIHVAGVETYCLSAKIYQVAELNYENGSNKLNVSETSHQKSDRKGKTLRSTSDYKTSEEDIFITDLKAITNETNKEMFQNIQGIPDKKFYIMLNARWIDSPQYHQSDLYGFKETADFSFSNTLYLTTMNNITFHMPSSPLLYQMNEETRSNLCNDTNVKQFCVNNSTENYCSCTQMYEVGLNDLVEVILFDSAPVWFYYPIHLHGYKFNVIGSGFSDNFISATPEDVKRMDENKKLLKRSFDRPVLRDTHVTPTRGYTILRFRAENPGYWLMQSQIVHESNSGMSMVFKVGNERNFPKQPKSWPKCTYDN